ncbi:MAG TPA: hypothetical protein VMB50_08155 [Myxococcales bacterium]|nr:hypothetical protein [Myxococcales bacterium]
MRKLMLPLLVLCGISFARVAVAQDDAAGADAAKPAKKAKKSHHKKAKKAKKEDAAAPAEGGDAK